MVECREALETPQNLRICLEWNGEIYLVKTCDQRNPSCVRRDCVACICQLPRPGTRFEQEHRGRELDDRQREKPA